MISSADFSVRPCRVLRGSALLLAIATLSLSVSAQSDSAPPPPPPGRLIDLGGYKLHLNCTGSGSPTPRDVLSQPHGRIAFANTDLAGASDHRNSIREADRAVQQLIELRPA